MTTFGMRLFFFVLSTAVLFLPNRCAAAGPAEVSATTYFKSPYVDLSEHFKIEEIEIGPMKMNMPLFTNYTLAVIRYGENDTETYVVKFYDEGYARLSIVFNGSNIVKDKGVLFSEAREYDLKLLDSQKKGIDVSKAMGGNVAACFPVTQSSFEYNSENGFFFYTQTKCEYDDRELYFNVFDGALCINGYSAVFMLIHNDDDVGFCKSFMTSWMDCVLRNNE